MEARSNVVKSIVKAFEILELLDNNGELGITEISLALGWDKSTAYRIALSLKETGYITQNPANSKYSNSFKLFEMGNNVVERLGLRRQAQSYLEQLSRITNETVNLAIMYEANILYIDKIESTATIKVNLNVGKKVPAYCSGLGKTMMAFMDEEKVLSVLKNVEFEKYTNKTITNTKDLLEQFKKIREQGFGYDDEEYVEGLKCIASPIFGYDGKVVAAVSLAIPKYRYDEGQKEIGYEYLVKTTANNISKELGFKNINGIGK